MITARSIQSGRLVLVRFPCDSVCIVLSGESVGAGLYCGWFAQSVLLNAVLSVACVTLNADIVAISNIVIKITATNVQGF